MGLIKKLRKAKQAVTEEGEKPECVKTHLRNMVIVPEMIGSIVGIYNGKTFNQVEIKPDMVKIMNQILVKIKQKFVKKSYYNMFINYYIFYKQIGHYLGEFSITYKPVKHGRPGIGATHSSRFVPLKQMFYLYITCFFESE